MHRAECSIDGWEDRSWSTKWDNLSHTGVAGKEDFMEAVTSNLNSKERVAIIPGSEEGEMKMEFA